MDGVTKAITKNQISICRLRELIINRSPLVLKPMMKLKCSVQFQIKLGQEERLEFRLALKQDQDLWNYDLDYVSHWSCKVKPSKDKGSHTGELLSKIHSDLMHCSVLD